MNQNNKQTAIGRRICIILLSFVMTVSMMPFFAFAEDIPSETGADISAESEIAPEDPKPETETPEETPAPEPEPSDNASDNASDDDQSQENSELPETAEFELSVPSVDTADSDELLTQYIEMEAGAKMTGTPAKDAQGTDSGIVRKNARLAARRSVLNSSEQIMFDGIKEGVTGIADGSTDSPIFAIKMTAAEYQACNFDKVINALLTDLPYEMYWCNKTEGALREYDKENNEAIVRFAVSADYRTSEVLFTHPYTDSNGVEQVFTVHRADRSKTGAASAAVSNAKKIVAENAALSDLDKLNKYRQTICSLTSYDKTITSGTEYGDPWQLIYVFDNDPATEVVCEGYSKAFQLLCNMSSFSNDTIECYTITGAFAGRSGTEGHMWNVLHMDDGRNYIADITNCDTGNAGSPDLLFLRGCTGGSVESGYVYLSSLRYIYDSDALSIYSTSELEMSDSDYSSTSVKVTHYPARAATCTASGTIEYWMKDGKYYSDNYCKREITKAQTVTAAKGHSWTEWKTVKSAFCTSPGSQKQTCSSCGASAEKSIPATGHSWRVTDTLDYIVHSCGRCGASYSVSKVVADLPKVSIKTPSKATAAFTAKWKKVSTKNRKKIAGIEIQYSTDSSFASAYTVSTAKKTATSRKFKKLARKTTYYVRVRSYKWTGGVKHVSAWSSVKRVKTK